MAKRSTHNPVSFMMAQRMRRMKAQGRPVKAICKAVGVSPATVWLYCGPNGYLRHRHRSNGRTQLRLVS